MYYKTHLIGYLHALFHLIILTTNKIPFSILITDEKTELRGIKWFVHGSTIRWRRQVLQPKWLLPPYESARHPAAISWTGQCLWGRCRFYPMCLSWWRKTGQGSGETLLGSSFLPSVGTFHEKACFPSCASCRPPREDSSCGKSCPLSGRMGSGEGQWAVPSLKRKPESQASGKATVTTQSSCGWNALCQVVFRAPVPALSHHLP